MCQISVLALDPTTGKIGGEAPKPVVHGRHVVTGADVLLRSATEEDSGRGQMPGRPMSSGSGMEQEQRGLSEAAARGAGAGPEEREEQRSLPQPRLGEGFSLVAQ